jgi:hypothetical protein
MSYAEQRPVALGPAQLPARCLSKGMEMRSATDWKSMFRAYHE